MFWVPYTVIFVAGLSMGYVWGDLHGAPALIAFLLLGFGKYVFGKAMSWLYDSELHYVKAWRKKHPFEIQLIEHIRDRHLVHDIYQCTEGGCRKIERLWGVQPVFYHEK